MAGREPGKLARAVAGRTVLRALLAAMLLPAPSGLLAAAPPSEAPVVIVEPRPETIVAGRQKIEVRLAPGLDSSLVQLEVRVDGVLIGRARRPPFVFELVAPGEPRAHTVEAVATFGGGRKASARVTTSPLKVDLSTSVRELLLPVSVLDGTNRFQAGLGAADLRVYDGGAELPLRDLWVVQQPLRLAVLLDSSSSMYARIGAARRVMEQISRGLGPEDEVALLTFLAGPEPILGFGRHGSELMRQAEALRISHLGFTGIYDSVAEVLEQHFAQPPPDRALGIVVLTDGLDTVSKTPPERIAERADALGVPLFVVGVRSPEDASERELPAGERRAHGKLTAWTRQARGRALYTTTGRDLGDAVGQMLTDLRSRYLLSLEPLEGRDDVLRPRVEPLRSELRAFLPPDPQPGS
jgi:hypothetical protein